LLLTHAWEKLALSLRNEQWAMDVCSELVESPADWSSVVDDRFDQIFPPGLRKLSSVFWTPLAIAARAAKLLVNKRGMRVLDIGCGAGKFCLIGAALTDGYFTGVEHRRDLAKAAKDVVVKHGITNVEIIQANITEHSFSKYDAFYLFNPFEENIVRGFKLNGVVPRSANLFVKYVKYVAAELAAKPLDTRVVTYAGFALEVPRCYECEQTAFGGRLKLWIKDREATADEARFGTSRHCSRRVAINRRVAISRAFLKFRNYSERVRSVQ